MTYNKGYELTIQYYDSIAKKYFESDASKVIKDKIDLFIANALPGGHIADIGCGPGHDARYLAENGFKIMGLDASKNMIEIASKISKDINYRVENILDFSFKDIFDGIWCSSLLVHIESKDINNVLKKFVNGLKKNGILGIITASKQEIAQKANDYRVYNMYTLDELTQLINNTGIKIIESSIFNYGGRDRLFIIGKK